MKVILLFLILFSHSVIADDSKHMVSFGRNGLGWSGGYEEMNTKSDSPFDDANHLFNNLSLNYAYRLGHRWQIGAYYQTTDSEHEFNKKGGGKSFAKMDTNIYGIFGLYNFDEDFNKAFYLGASISYFSIAEENSHNWTETEGKSPFELDDAGNTYELMFGKRFAFDKWDIKHLTYSPSISVYYREHAKDFDDQGIRRGIGASIQPIKFDFLF